jgi:hypothetical protein
MEIGNPQAIEALARFEFDRLERESDLRPTYGPKEWEDCEPALREEMLTWARGALGAVAEATGDEGPPMWPRSEWTAELRFVTDNDRLAAQSDPENFPRNVHEWTLDEIERAQDRGIVPRSSVRLEVLDGVKTD